MVQKQVFYDNYGVEEYYIYDPDDVDLAGMIRREGRLDAIEDIQGWVSPRLGIRFQLDEDSLTIFTPTGEPFLGFIELDRRRRDAEERASRAEERAATAEARLQAIEQRLRDLGLDEP
ncbi:MAG: hypothetical protein HLUCCO16_20665 [Phormidium sp. OSCR]|nr:MAG: hypothetical protein HLUCCO16_20665 [Phormidium sp. OSCR]